MPPLGLTKERRQERSHEQVGDDELSRKQTAQDHSLGASTGEECSDAQLILFCQDLQSLEILPSPSTIFPEWVRPGKGLLGMSPERGSDCGPEELLKQIGNATQLVKAEQRQLPCTLPQACEMRSCPGGHTGWLPGFQAPVDARY